MKMTVVETGMIPTSKFPIRYKGLFAPSAAPTKRAYCILFSIFFGIIEVTIGSILYHVIALHPMSGGQPMHTPSLSLSLGLIILGIITILATFWVTYRYGLDDGDEDMEDDSRNFVKEDVLSFSHEATSSQLPPA